MYQLIIFLLASLFACQVNAQDKEMSSPILFIFDASGSMWGQLEGKTKKEIAADVLSTSVNNLPGNQNVGLMAYGHRTEGDCDDVEFLVDLSNNSKSKVTEAVEGVRPLGRTPLARSATMAINSIRDSKVRATIILITDGIESCDGNICDVVTIAKADGVDFKLHVVGFGLKESEADQLKCAAQAGGGHYYDAVDASGLSESLTGATSETIDEPASNFSAFAMKNGAAIDAVIKAYDIGTKRQPITLRTYKDTVYGFLPPSTYNLEVTPLEGSDVDAITIEGVQSFEDKVVHQSVSFDGSKVDVSAKNNGLGWDATVVMHHQATGKVAARTRTYGKTQTMEVNPGTYDVTFQALKIKGTKIHHTINGVVVKAGETRALEHSFNSVRVNLTTLNNGEGWDATIKVLESGSGKNIANTRTYETPQDIEINPGTYDFKIQALAMNGLESSYTVEGVVVKTGEPYSLEHNFTSGIANLGVSENGTLIDCTVNIYETASGKSIAGKRSYTSASSNPRPFVLNPGNYTVKLRGTKNGKDTMKEFSITVKEGESFTKMYEW